MWERIWIINYHFRQACQVEPFLSFSFIETLHSCTSIPCLFIRETRTTPQLGVLIFFYQIVVDSHHIHILFSYHLPSYQIWKTKSSNLCFDVFNLKFFYFCETFIVQYIIFSHLIRVLIMFTYEIPQKWSSTQSFTRGITDDQMTFRTRLPLYSLFLVAYTF